GGDFLCFFLLWEKRKKEKYFDEILNLKSRVTQTSIFLNSYGFRKILIILAALGIAQASLALPSFAQNLHKICALHLIH
ncbi:MAG: hypothetical protein PF590_00155, partial [Candidatus Delongbacteria bacterium]|nr:hypothetical protein [Candidatus Delongbacteria bacterium]